MQGRGAIVIGGYVNGLGVLRALAARGIPTAVVTTQPYDLAQRSRWCVAAAAATALDADSDALRAVLDRWRTRFAGFALVPTTDEALVAIGRHRDDLERDFRVVAPPSEVVARLVDKRELLRAARAVGVDVPRCYGAATADLACRADVAYPVVVKPVVGYRFVARFGVKLLVARDPAELRAAIARVHAADVACEVFDLVPGRDDQIWAYCTYVDRRGAAAPGVTVRKRRQSPASFGVARVATVVDDLPALRDATLAIARRLDLRGIVASEFKRDPRDGRFRFLEVNGRSVIYNALLRRAGLDVAGLAWSEQVTGRAEAQVRSRWRGTWVNLHADLLHSTLRREEDLRFGDFAAPYVGPWLEAVWSPRDPLPFLAQWARTARLAVSRARPSAASVAGGSPSSHA